MTPFSPRRQGCSPAQTSPSSSRRSFLACEEMTRMGGRPCASKGGTCALNMASAWRTAFAVWPKQAQRPRGSSILRRCCWTREHAVGLENGSADQWSPVPTAGPQDLVTVPDPAACRLSGAYASSLPRLAGEQKSRDQARPSYTLFVVGFGLDVLTTKRSGGCTIHRECVPGGSNCRDA